MKKLLNLFTRLAYQRLTIFWLLLFALLLHIGTTVQGGFYADDYIQMAYFHGPEQLAEKGLLDGVEPRSFTSVLVNQFNFFNPATENHAALMEKGVLPWWTGDQAMLHFFRPLASATHYLDYRLWPDSSRMMHFISLLWYVLGLAVVYLLYRGVGVEKSIALLALLLVILDQSVFQVVTWIASRSMLMVIAIGFFSVYAYHRSMQDRRWYVVALIGLLLALLSAEGAIGICAYLGAYMFTLDQRRWGQRLLHILPFALITIIWHLLYQRAGFGAYGVDFYLDPGREPGVFLYSALYRLPGNFFELASGMDFFSGQIRQDIRNLVFALLGLASFAGFFWLLWPQLKTDRTLRFFLLGSCFALVPGLAIALAPRVMILPNVGFAIVLATVMVAALKGFYQRGRKYLAWLVSGYTLLMHIIIAVLLAAFMTGNMIHAAISGEEERGYVDLGVDDYENRHLVVVNSLRPFWLSFTFHQLDYHQRPLPETQRVLSSSFYPLVLTRLSDNELLLQAEPVMQLDSETVTGFEDKPAVHFMYLTQQLLGLTRASREPWQAGDEFIFPEMTIRVAALYQSKPQALHITLHKPEADYRWVFQDIDNNRYAPLALPAMGASINLEGMFVNQ